MSLSPVDPIDIAKLQALLKEAKEDSSFRDKLLKSPKDTLTAKRLRPDLAWIVFFSSLTESNFAEVIQRVGPKLIAEANEATG